MSLWWLQPGWTDACCASCGQRIYPDSDPDWGKCFQCFTVELEANRAAEEQYQAEMVARAALAEKEKISE